MLLIFHFLIPFLICKGLLYIKKDLEIDFMYLFVGSLLADFIDKPLSILGISNGRGIAHTLLFTFTIFSLIFAYTQETSKILPFLFGQILHLLMDLPMVPLFYPFIKYEWSIISFPLSISSQSLIHCQIGHYISLIFSNSLYLIIELCGVFTFSTLFIKKIIQQVN
jgi:hypothetical protein